MSDVKVYNNNNNNKNNKSSESHTKEKEDQTDENKDNPDFAKLNTFHSTKFISDEKKIRASLKCQ
jgi:ribosomal protein S18